MRARREVLFAALRLCENELVADYPIEWESDVVLSDGGVVHVRPVKREDAAGFVDLISRLSDDSIRYRFFTLRRHISDAELDRFVTVDYDNRMALVVELEGSVIAVGRYDRLVGGESAEVAFLVADEHQRRGIGMVLLEHLAAIARTHAITRFEAMVLPDNRSMLRVFADAGFTVRRRFEDGVIRVEFPITTTPRESLAIREHHAEAASIRRLLHPSSVAVVGASRRPDSVGQAVLHNLLDAGFRGHVHPVNPSAKDVLGVPAFGRASDIPGGIDLGIITLPASLVPDAVDDCGAAGASGVVIISSGFAEVGDQGRELQHETVRRARHHGMRVLGPNCLGIMNLDPEVRLDATFARNRPPAGNIGFFTQSGALGIAMLGWAADSGLGLSSFVSAGNKADVSGNDLLQYWGEDEATDVVLLYLESFGNPRKFARIAPRVARTKPIVVVKAGRSPAGQRGAQSHTAALAAPEVAVEALFDQAGVIRVSSAEEMLDAARMLACQPVPAGRSLAIIGNSGGPAIMAADAATAAGCVVPELGHATQEQLRRLLGPTAGVRNPVDGGAGVTPALLEEATRIVLADGAIDGVLFVHTATATSRSNAAGAALTAAAQSTAKPLAAVFLPGGGDVSASLRVPGSQRAIPVFRFPEAAAAAFARAGRYGEWRSSPQHPTIDAPQPMLKAARAMLDGWASEPDAVGEWLSPDRLGHLLSVFGVGLVSSSVVADAPAAVAAAKVLGHPVALKVIAEGVLHKTDVGGVALGLETPEAVEDAFRSFHDRFGPALKGAVVQQMAPQGVELIVGVHQDPQFGPLLVVGAGGITAELMADRAVRLLPVSREDIEEMLDSLRSRPLLEGFRGAERVEREPLVDLIVGVARFAEAVPELRELDLNPVIATARGVFVVDARARLSYEPDGSGDDPAVRRLRPT